MKNCLKIDKKNHIDQAILQQDKFSYDRLEKKKENSCSLALFNLFVSSIDFYRSASFF